MTDLTLVATGKYLHEETAALALCIWKLKQLTVIKLSQPDDMHGFYNARK